MPKLPGGERAVIDPRKLRDYILAPRHPLGRFKAAFFNTLGYNADNWELLAAELRKAALEHEAEPDDRTPYGQKYRVRSILIGPNGRVAPVVAVWIVLNDEDTARFITIIPRGRR